MRYAILASSAALLFFAGCFQRTTTPDAPPVRTGSSESGAVATTSDGEASSAPVPSDTELDSLAKRARRVWRYDDARHTYNSGGGAGRFLQAEGTVWKHQIDAFPQEPKDFEEIARTDDYIELKDWTGTQIYRLYADRFESRPSHVAEFSSIGPGRWAPEVDPREIAQIVASRTFWRYANAPDIFQNQASHAGVFRQENPRVWIEDRVGNVPSNWIEQSRTDDYVELSRPDGGFFVRLYADRSEYRYGNESEYKPMFPGKWVGDAELPAAKN